MCTEKAVAGGSPTSMAGVFDGGWSAEHAEARDFVIKCMNLAEIEADIIEDIADACEVTGYTTPALAADDVCLETVAEKLFLTEQEAATLIEVCRVEMSKLAGKSGAPLRQTGYLAKNWDILGEGLQGFDGAQTEEVKPAGMAAVGDLGGPWKGAAARALWRLVLSACAVAPSLLGVAGCY